VSGRNLADFRKGTRTKTVLTLVGPADAGCAADQHAGTGIGDEAREHSPDQG